MADLHKSDVRWFALREPDLLDQLHYPLTASVKAWTDTLVVLAKVTVEGLDKKFLEGYSKSKGATGDTTWNSISWAREAMKASGLPEEIVDEAISPLRTIQELRSKLGAHSRGSEAAKIRAELLRQYKTPRLHIEHLCSQLARSVELLRSQAWT